MLSTQKVSDWAPPDIKAFEPSITDDPSKPESYSDDINLQHYVASNRTWAGEQRNGFHYNITDATSRTDHVEKAILEPFHLAGEIPIPPEVTRAMDFISSTPDRSTRQFWRMQLSRLMSIVKGGRTHNSDGIAAAPVSSGCQITHPDSTDRPTPSQLGVGGEQWAKQVIYGFDIVGRISQMGAFESDPKVKSREIFPRYSTPVVPGL